ncbi:zinc finger MYM-type protein 1-like isoform X2 [Aphis craccivora]|uniref:Zinc finger MYM-type protein 1-like isoform X2 n=1 Tax=Aphis craccivora TaxID=307492 RepID=A0A6G0X3Y3_APHCR|nr:zinc finger MYM-type protein 1-like isoform X2 [Aphis craccivora]
MLFLQHEIEKGDILQDAKKLKRLCATRWIQRYDAVNDFIQLLPFVVNALQTIATEWKDSSSIVTDMLKKAITESEFLISLYVIKVLFSYGLPLLNCKLGSY